MSIQVNYPSKYFEASLSAKERIPTTVVPNLTANEKGVTPLHNFITQGNEAEIKFLNTNHREILVKAIEETEALSIETTNAIFKVLHDAVHRVKGEYTMEAFENSFASTSGVSSINYITRVEKDKTVEEIKEGLTGLGFYNFAKNFSWTDNSLVSNEKGEFSAGNNYLQSCLYFFRTYNKEFFYKKDGLTAFHELAVSDKNLSKIVALTEFFDLDLTECVNDYNETVLSVMITNGCKKLVSWFLSTYGSESINDIYATEDGDIKPANSACALMFHALKFGTHAQEYINSIDETDLDESCKSALNYYNSNSKIDLSEIKLMSAKLMKEKSGIKKNGSFITFEQIILNNRSDVAAAQKK